MVRVLLIFSVMAVLLPVSPAWAGETPQEQRHELMEDVKEAAKPVGEMLKGEREFEPGVVRESFQFWASAVDVFGELFPPGSESGYDTEARETIWADREGFNAALESFALAVNQGIEANPQELEELKRVAGPVFDACKACHEEYRVEHEH